MSRVSGKNTKPELVVRSLLHNIGYRFRLHRNDLPGKPDIILPKYKKIIFVHGCFWHVHDGCNFSMTPSSRKEFWSEKFETNEKRDKRNYDALLASGWRVLVVWECAIKTRKNNELDGLGSCVSNWLKSDDRYGEIGRNHVERSVCRKRNCARLSKSVD